MQEIVLIGEIEGFKGICVKGVLASVSRKGWGERKYQHWKLGHSQEERDLTKLFLQG